MISLTRSIPGMGSLTPRMGGTAALRGDTGCAGAAGGPACGVAGGVVVIGVSVSAGGLVSEVDGTGTSGGSGSAVALLGAGVGAAGVVVRAGAGVVADLSCEFSPIATAAPTSSTAAAVRKTAAAGSRRHRANVRLRTGVAASIREVAAVSGVAPTGVTRD